MHAYTDITADQLRQFMATNHERNYRLIDVREEREYRSDHIPGALLVPLSELNTLLPELPTDGDLIIYCRSGHRSRSAALFIAENSSISGRILNLSGGILDWKGLTLPDFPNLRVFSADGVPATVFRQAMDLERGAHHFYQEVLNRYPQEPFSPAIQRLARAEEDHARLLYSFYQKEVSDCPPFDQLYESLAGEIVEGGHTLSTLQELLDGLGENPCVDIVEIAVAIEYSAYDLYRNMADRFKDHETLNSTFVSIAQAEKEHMRQAAAMLKLQE